MIFVTEWLFKRWEYAHGIGWIFLPAGARLLCTLLFGNAGTLGLLIASWIMCFFFYFPDDFIRSVMGGIFSAFGPYIAFLIIKKSYGLRSSLINLNTKYLLFCILANAIASPLLHHVWFYMHDQNTEHIFQSFIAMFVGDLIGTLVVVYALKAVLAWIPVSQKIPDHNFERSGTQ